MSYTDRDLELIRANPDIVIVEDERATPMPLAAVQGKMSEHELQAAVIAKCDERAKTEARGVAEGTAIRTTDNIAKKLQLGNRTRATLYALRHGIVTLDEACVVAGIGEGR